MFAERVRSTFALNEPIFTEELLRLFSDYSRVQVFRLIDAAKQNGDIVQYTKGVYYIPQKTRLGNSTITADDVVRKRYIKNADDVYGVYSGLKLLNAFSVTTQMAGIVEVVTNNEASRVREIQVNNRHYILRRSRCTIGKNNAAAYTVMQLFSELGKEESLDESAIRKLRGYVAKESISPSQLFSMAQVFPARATKKMIGSGIINGAI